MVDGAQEGDSVSMMRPGDAVEVFVRDIDWKRSIQPRWERAVFEEITPARFIRAKMVDGTMRAFDVEDVRSVAT